jgi:ATP-dependent exoDNAse (exonuclease V) alpha subunit
VAIFHLSVKTISRTAGRSSTAAAAYRAGVEITDERTGEIHDYRRKAGVESAELFLPDGAPEWATDRAKLWNAAEQSEKRKNSTVAREFEVALPSELSADQRRKLAHDFARELVKRHGFAVDVAIHAPGKEGDTRNHHAHILCTTRKLTAEGFTEKTRELDDRATGAQEVTHWREQWAGLTNAALEGDVSENGK